MAQPPWLSADLVSDAALTQQAGITVDPFLPCIFAPPSQPLVCGLCLGT